MRKLLWFIGFVGLVFVGDRTAAHFLQKQVDASQFRYSRLYRGDAAADILLVGNSRGLAFFQPYIEQTTGKSTFNLSYNGMPMYAAAALAEDYLDRYPAPKQLVLDITICDRKNDELLTGFLTYASHSPRLSALLRDSVPKMYWGAQVMHLTRFNSEIFQRALYYRNTLDEDWLIDRVITEQLAETVGGNSYNVSGDNKERPKLVGYLKSLVEYAQAKGVQVELVIGPYFPQFKVENLEILKADVEKATGLQVHDYRGALSDPQVFGDYMHPNKKGAEQYIDLLRRDSVLP